MAVTSKILEFPPEMLGAIAAQAEDYDLLSVRAVCLKRNSVSDDIFLAIFFTTRTHIFWDHSLDALKSISLVPRLAKAVKEVRIVAQCSLLRCWSPECRMKRGVGEYRDIENSNDHGHYSNYNKLSGALQESLSNLSKYNKAMSFAVSTRASEPAYGRSKFLKLRIGNEDVPHEGDDLGCFDYHRCTHEVPELVLDAAAKSSILIECLDIGYDDRSYGLFPLHTHKSALSGDPDFKRILKAPFSNLTSVKLGIYAEYWKWNYLNQFSRMREVLQTAVHLQDLSIAILPSPSTRMYEDPVAQYGSASSLAIFNNRYIVEPFAIPKLKRLELKYMNSAGDSGQRVLDFMNIFRETLQHVKLVRLFLHFRSSRAFLIESLASLPRIEKLEICGMDTAKNLDNKLEAKDVNFMSYGNVSKDGERDIITALKSFAHDLKVPEVEEESSGDNGENEDGG